MSNLWNFTAGAASAVDSTGINLPTATAGSLQQQQAVGTGATQGQGMPQGMAPNLNPMLPSVYVGGSPQLQAHQQAQMMHQLQGIPTGMMPTGMMPTGMMPYAVPSSMQQLAAQQHAMAMQMNQMMQQAQGMQAAAMQVMMMHQTNQQSMMTMQQPQGTECSGTTAKNDVKWEKHLKYWVQWKEQNRDKNCPTTNTEIGRWIKHQRFLFKNHKLRPDRYAKLVELGFVFSVRAPVPVPSAAASVSSADLGGATDVPSVAAPVPAAAASAQVPAVRAAPAPPQATGPTASTNEATAAAPPANQGGAINGLEPASEDVPPPQSVAVAASTNVASAPPQATSNSASNNGALVVEARVVLAATAPPQAADSTASNNEADSASSDDDSIGDDFTPLAADQDEEIVYTRTPTRTATNNNDYDSDTSSVLTDVVGLSPPSIMS